MAFLITGSCERDDICSNDTSTTPRLFIEFRDINNQDELKPVRRLRVIGIDEAGVPIDTLSIEETDPSSVLLPLRVLEQGTLTTTRYILEKNSDLADDDDDTTNSEQVIIEIRCTGNFVYVSRACGYKSVFDFGLNGSFIITNNPDNWALNSEIVNDFIENEDEAQVYIYH